ncbi:MAG: hypothetical protein A2541_01130 [Candidatus Taylorbacteria bacterium RIFOXYD2_FULL_36_9]|uniref:Aminotransferase class V domain-containing protein n=1 Tax=Candidatus Taylorbacteria bacterium RIFOXYD2_FULL_36_9 TaxID=1802338 RepID=A0A1G2PHD7_9BACT|nr:MAG: hypothetical protein A2541_01130 [Candidatus Taylorbacteria bacterium RIFOXYD2_FULL_36_9]
MKKIIYLDNVATTPVKKEVILAMKPYWTKNFGNPGSITKIGVKAKQAVENSRKIIAECLKGRPQEIVFTSGGTESNNLAIFGVIKNLENKGVKVSDMSFITSNIEHSSITECFKELERRGAQVDYLKVNSQGLINPKDLRKMIKPNTVLISIGYANNEIGTIQPIKEIAKEIRHARKIYQGISLIFHTDASQAGLYCNLNVNELGVDLLTLDSQKIYGPKGVGILFVKAGVKISPIIFGGGQERGLRSGTENVPLIVGMAKALELVFRQRELLVTKIEKLRNYFWQKIQEKIPKVVLNGGLKNRLPNNLNISIHGLDSEFAVLCLDEEGIICSTKSACNHDEDGSFVVKALGVDEAIYKSTLRFSLGEGIIKKDIDLVIAKLLHICK